MQERTAQILEAAIQEFINSGEPVSSGRLFDNYEFGIRPAMIRLELDELERQGFLEQPYHSAGRVPTDAGYEFFVNSIAKKMQASAPHEVRETALQDLFEERAWQDLLQHFSSQLGLLGVVADMAHDMVYKAGLEQLVKNLDWESREDVSSVIRDFEQVDGRVANMAEKLREGPNVFIGKKSPVTKSENLSVIAGNYQVGDATISIFAIGPKRMDYKKVMQILKNL